ncbi:MAG: FtsX-like permease family protein, partial [Bacteroidota bacterium]
WSSQLREQFPEVLQSVRHTWFGYPASITYPEGDKIDLSEGLIWTENTYADVFDLPIIYGTKGNALAQPNSIAVSETAAKQLFGDVDPVGKQLVVEHPFFQGQLATQVGAVFADPPSNSHMQPEYLINIEMLKQAFGEEFFSGVYDGWEQDWFASYVVLKPGTDVASIQQGLAGMLDTHVPEEARARVEPVFRPMRELHFDTEFEWTTEGMGDMNYIFMFGSIALLIMLIACINYMNLATARASRRAKEIGLRKTLGSRRIQLIAQFLGESFVMVLLGTIGAVVIMLAVLDPFNILAQKSFMASDLFVPEMLGIMAAVVIGVGLLAGIYPALVLSGFQPVAVLRGRFGSGKGSERLRQGLVVLQFTMSLILIISTGFIVRQMNYLQNATLSQGGDQMLSIRFGGVADPEKYEAFKAKAQQDPEMGILTMGNHLPRQDWFGGITYGVRLPGLRDEVLEWDMLNVEHDFTEAFELELLSGRLFEEADQTGSHVFVMNETAIRNLDLTPEGALGTALTVMTGDTSYTGQVIGVVKDFSYRSVKHAISPMLLSVIPHPIDKIVYAKLPAGKIQDKISDLEAAWKEVYPGVGFDYWFLSDEFGRMYTTEKRLADLTQVFAILAIIVACLGVFGLAAYLAERRAREIGIRKVLGASVANILLLLSRTFVITVLVACVIAVPVAYFLMSEWMQNFVYHVDLSWWMFLVAILGVLGLTLLTSSYETLRVALSNPIKHIRDE